MYLQYWKHMTSQSIRAFCCLCCYKGAEGTWLKSIIGGGIIHRCLCWNIVGIKWPQLFSKFAMEYLLMGTKGNSCFLRWIYLLMQLVFDCTINRALKLSVINNAYSYHPPCEVLLGFLFVCFHFKILVNPLKSVFYRKKRWFHAFYSTAFWTIKQL